MVNKIYVKQIKSPIRRPGVQRKILKGLGLNKMNKDLKALAAYSAILILAMLLLKQTPLFSPTIILIGEYVQLKFPLKKPQ